MFGRGYRSDTVPTFEQGYLLFKVRTGGFEVFGPDGVRRFFAVVENPAGSTVMSLAADSDGSIAVGLAFPGPQGFNGGIAYFDPSGKQTRFVDTGKYRPAHICFDRDHSLWTFGEQRDSSNDSEERSDYMMFRKYSVDGKETGRYGPRSIVPWRGLTPGGPSIGPWILRVVDDRVGALAESGNSDLTHQVWIELGLDGHLIGTWATGKDLLGGLAFTSDARLCRQTPRKPMPRIQCLDRDTGVWKDAGEAPVSGVLLGAQGDELVFSDGDKDVVRLYWVKVP
jgi:hypothetical protein